MVKLVRVVSAMVVAGVCLGALSAAEAQSLADVARQEAERRKAAEKARKTYTNDDLKGGRPLTTMGAAAKPPQEEGQDKAAKGEQGPGKGPTDESVAKRVAELKEELSQLQRDKAQTQQRVDEINSKVLETTDQASLEQLVRERDATIEQYRRLEVDIAAQGKLIAGVEAAAATPKPPSPPQ
jgi:hypothetical protein